MLTREKTAEVVRCFDYGTIPGDVTHRGECVKPLGTANSWHAIHAKGGHLPLSQGVDNVLILTGIQKRIQRTVLAKQLGLR